jgi:hypothetical protein
MCRPGLTGANCNQGDCHRKVITAPACVKHFKQYTYEYNDTLQKILIYVWKLLELLSIGSVEKGLSDQNSRAW